MVSDAPEVVSALQVGDEMQKHWGKSAATVTAMQTSFNAAEVERCRELLDQHIQTTAEIKALG